MKNVEFIITTIDRYDFLKDLLDSIFEFYPEAHITIADQSKEIRSTFYDDYKMLDIKVLPLPYDCGISYARNKLVENTKREFILLLEDDFIFTKDTDINKLLTLTDLGDIIGGGVYEGKNRLEFEFYLNKKGDTIYQEYDGNNWKHYKGIKYKNTGCVMNFTLFRRKVFDKVKWKEELKLMEHQHFYFRVKNTVLFTDDVKILDNKKNNPHEYKKLRNREEYFIPALEDLGAKRIRYLNGQIFEIEGDTITRYREHKFTKKKYDFY